MSSEKSFYRSGELAELAGVSTDTLRHYERKGVLINLTIPRRPQQQQARSMQWDKGKNCIEMKSSNSTHIRRLSVNHKKLAIAVDLAVTTCKVSHKPYQVKPPDAAELDEINAVIEVFNIGITIVKVFQPLRERF